MNSAAAHKRNLLLHAELAPRILSIMTRENISIMELARGSDSSHQTIRCILDGDRLPRADTLLGLALALGVSADWLLGIDNE